MASGLNAKSRLIRLAALLLLAFVALQLSLALRLALMLWLDPQSTSFQRSEAWRLMTANAATSSHSPGWAQNWLPLEQISPNLVRAIVASEDSGFFEHAGFDWDALQKAARRNHVNQGVPSTAARKPADTYAGDSRNASGQIASQTKPPSRPKAPKLVGGSTISQQLAKNLLLSSERTWLRKAQEFILTACLELLLTKERILEIYLNSVEWGEGVFGAQAAAWHYFGTDASKLGMNQAAKLAVMLPAPKRFEKNPNSPYLQQRAAIIQSRMADVNWP